ncbi:MAG TPA: response regulator [Acetobacteraceae bacterium]|nr:response regulator [Acetobacteraceae bacterium]
MQADGRAIALVDDDSAVRDSMRFLLEIEGYDILDFPSAAEFLDECALDRIRGLILDHHMPLMTGLELAAHLRKQGNAIPILLITGSPSPAIVARAAELGIDKVLEKPPSETDLLQFVANLPA